MERGGYTACRAFAKQVCSAVLSMATIRWPAASCD
jgi:hypothetical protein